MIYKVEGKFKRFEEMKITVNCLHGIIIFLDHFYFEIFWYNLNLLLIMAKRSDQFFTWYWSKNFCLG